MGFEWGVAFCGVLVCLVLVADFRGLQRVWCFGFFFVGK